MPQWIRLYLEYMLKVLNYELLFVLTAWMFFSFPKLSVEEKRLFVQQQKDVTSF